MNYKLALLVAAIVCAGGLMVPKTAEAFSVDIAIGDRPYYVHGPWYWHHGVRWYWIPGHYSWHHHHRVWVPGHYAPR